MPTETPMGVAMIICDQIITEAGTNKKLLIGTFNNLFSHSFPCVHPAICVFVVLTNGQGRHVPKLRVVNQDVGQKLFEVALTSGVEFENPLHSVEVAFKLANVPFPIPGVHGMELWCNDELVLTRRFRVTKIEEQE